MSDLQTKILRITENMSLVEHWATHCKKMEVKYRAKTYVMKSGSNLKQTGPFWAGALEKAREDYGQMVIKRRKLIDEFKQTEFEVVEK